MDTRNKDRVKTYTKEQLKPENTIFHVYRRDGLRVYTEDLHLNREREVTVCGVNIGTSHEDLMELRSVAPDNTTELERLEKIELQERIKFWNGRRLSEAEIVRPSIK